MMLRVAVCFVYPTSLDDDPDAYAAIGITLANTGTFGLTSPDGQPYPMAFRPPLYPWLLSFLVDGDHLNRTGLICLHALLGGVTVIGTVLASRQLLGDSGIVAGTIVAIDPILLQQSTLVMTETLAAALATAVIAWWTARCASTRQIRFAAILGGLLSLAYLCRPTFLVWAVLLILASAINGRCKRDGWVRGIVATLVLGVVVGAWTVRNHHHFDRWVWATTHGGYTLLLANNPMFYDYLRTRSPGQVWNPETFFDAWQHRDSGDVTEAEFWQRDWSVEAVQRSGGGGGETLDDDRASDAARATIRREPKMFVASCFVRVARLWSPLPHVTPGRSSKLVIATAVFYTMLYLACCRGVWCLGRRVMRSPWWAIWLLALTLSAVHAVYWSNLRMRSPVTCGVAILAAAGMMRRGGVADGADAPAVLRCG